MSCPSQSPAPSPPEPRAEREGEEARRRALETYCVLDTPGEAVFDEIGALAAQVCATPFAAIAFIDGDRHWFKSIHGPLEAREVPRGESLFDRLVESPEGFEVADAALDVRFHGQPLFAGPDRVRFFAGRRLVCPGGHVLGALAVFDHRPRVLEEAGRLALAKLADVTVRLLEARRMEREAAWFGEIVEQCFNEILVFDVETHRVLHANRGALDNLGYTLEEIRRLTGADLACGWGEAARRRVNVPLLRGERRDAVVEVEARRRDGSTYPVESRIQLSSAWGRPVFLAVSNDISARKAAEEALFREHELARITLASIGDAMITTDAHGRVTYLNPVAERLTGWTSREAAGRPIEAVFRVVSGSDGRDIENPVDRVLREGATTGLDRDARLLSRDGRSYSVEDSAAPIRDRGGVAVGVVLVFRDVTESRSLAQSLAHQASHDALTGLVNRREFERVLATLIASSRAQGLAHALLYIDLDQFKVVNDTCGHGAGDALLRQAAEVLAGPLRRSDTLARLGGDEFGVALEGCDLPQARRIAAELLERLRAFRFQWNERAFRVSASIGVAALDAASPGVEAALSAADTACFLAKDKGRNQVQVFHVDDEELSVRRGEMAWVSRINGCLAENRFFLVCQRVERLLGPRAGSTEYLEVLLRMRAEDGSVVPPMAFIPAAERYDIMPAIDRWVIAKALACLRRLLDEGLELPRFAINVSGRSLSDPGLLDFVLGELAATGVPAIHLCFEITETAAVAHLGRAARLMERLRAEGCRFALDDFGCGLSSFTYLKNLPVDYLKIDGSFVRSAVRDPVDRAMVAAIRQLGQTMGIRTIAESIEDAETLACMRAIGVDFAQGRLIHPPEVYGARRAMPACEAAE